MPPEWMWPFDEELEHWFEDVERQRKSKWGRHGDEDEEIDGPVMENELTKGLR
jgi:hypothetical protein